MVSHTLLVLTKTVSTSIGQLLLMM